MDTDTCLWEAQGRAHRDVTGLLQSLLTCPRFELVTLTNIIQSPDILREQSARFINPANFRSAHAVFWLLVTIMHYRSIPYPCLCRSDVQYFEAVITLSDQLHEGVGTGWNPSNPNHSMMLWLWGWTSPSSLRAQCIYRHHLQQKYSNLIESLRDPHHQIHFLKWHVSTYWSLEWTNCFC